MFNNLSTKLKFHRIKQAFESVKHDMGYIKEWIFYLDREQRMQKEKIAELEQRLEKLE
jgi:hypothetical protein